LLTQHTPPVGRVAFNRILRRRRHSLFKYVSNKNKKAHFACFVGVRVVVTTIMNKTVYVSGNCMLNLNFLASIVAERSTIIRTDGQTDMTWSTRRLILIKNIYFLYGRRGTRKMQFDNKRVSDNQSIVKNYSLFQAKRSSYGKTFLLIRKLQMGCKESKASNNTANVINTVEVKNEILGVQHTISFIAVM